MSFRSDLPAETVLITEHNWDQYTLPEADIVDGQSVSCSGFVEKPEGMAGVGAAFPDELRIPRNEWREKIEQLENTGSRLSDLCTRAGAIWLNQNPSWYCWCYCVVHAVMALEAKQNEEPRRLVPESVAGPIMGYRKKGGWPDKAVEYVIEHGIADTTAWPWENHRQANSRQYFDRSRDNAALTKITEWVDVRGFDELASCLLHRIPVPVGLGWMGHAMCAIDLVVMPSGEYGVVYLDSYAKRGKYNTKTITESKAVGGNMIAPIAISPNRLGGPGVIV